MRTGQAFAVVFASFWSIAFLNVQSTPSSGSPSFAALSLQAAAARDSEHLDRAAGLYRQALAIKPDWAEGWWFLGTIEYDLSHYPEAVSALKELCTLDSKAGSGRVMLGLSEFELGQDSAALAHIEEGERIGVADNQQLRNVALFHQGVLLQRKAKYEEAERALGSLCSSGVETPGLLAALGMVALRRPDRAAPAQAPAAEVVSRAGHAQCMAARKQFDDARREYVAIAHDFPLFPNVHYAFGRFLIDAHDTAGGIAELEAEIKLRPDDAIARLQIAAAKYKVDSAAGLPYARAAVKHDPGLPLGHYLLGLLLLDTGDYRSAIPELEAAQRSMSQQPGVYSALGAAYSQAGRDEDAARARATLQHLNRESSTSAAPLP